MKKIAIFLSFIINVNAQVLSFNGDDDNVEFIDSNGKYGFDSTEDFTVEVWFLSKKTTRHNQGIFTKGYGFESNGYMLVKYPDGTMHFAQNNKEHLISSSEIINGDWNHVAISKKSDKLLMYLNGKKDGELTVSNRNFGTNTYPLIMAMGNYDDAPSGEHLNGNIKEFRMWNYARTENQILSGENEVFSASEDGLIAYFKYNVMNTAVFYDFSINANHGKLNGAVWNFEITSINDLIKLSQTPNMWSSVFIQTNDIDASLSKYFDDSDDDSDGDKYNDPNDLTSEGNNEGFPPIGGYNDKPSNTNPINFTGIYDGKGFLIKNLYMDREFDNLNNVGFFGKASDATLKNINLVNVNIIGGNYTGGLLGLAENGNSIINCLTTGSISSVQGSSIGGLIGKSEGVNQKISFSYSLCDVNGNNGDVGGLIGRNQSEIDNCYAFGKVSGNAYDVGGLVGRNQGIIKNSYSINTVNGGGRVGALVGTNEGTVSFSVWDKTLSGNSLGIGLSETGSTLENVSGKTTSEMKTESTFTKLNWDFEKSNETEVYWMIDNDFNDGIVNNGYPYFSLQLPVKFPFLSTDDDIIVSKFTLHENYPNPFNPTTTLRFDLPEVSNITLTIFNMLGQKIRTYDMQSAAAGYHTLKWNATNDYGDPVGAGVYLYQLQSKDFVKTRKMVLLK
jgi:hypothetical protein